MGYIFISYKSEEKDRANALKKFLEDNDIKCWMAPESINAGESHSRAINNAIKNCSCLILVLTEIAQTSLHVRTEINLAINNRKNVIPLKFDRSMELNADFEYLLANYQIKYVEKIDINDNIMKKVLNDIKGIIDNCKSNKDFQKHSNQDNINNSDSESTNNENGTNSTSIVTTNSKDVTNNVNNGKIINTSNPFLIVFIILIIISICFAFFKFVLPYFKNLTNPSNPTSETLAITTVANSYPNTTLPTKHSNQYTTKTTKKTNEKKSTQSTKFDNSANIKKEIEKCCNNQINTISAGDFNTVAITSHGDVVVVGSITDNEKEYDKIKNWKNIKAVSAGGKNLIVGLTSEGKVKVAGDNGEEKFDKVFEWENIKAVSVGQSHIVGLTLDGYVFAAGNNSNQQCDVENWKNEDILTISAGYDYTVGLKSDGTVITTSKDYDVSKLRNIIAISAGGKYIAALTSDKTVEVVSKKGEKQIDVSELKSIDAVSAGEKHIVALKARGKVMAYAAYECHQCDVYKWDENIVAVSAGYYHTVGLNEYGDIVAVGDNKFHQCDCDSEWKEIKIKTTNK